MKEKNQNKAYLFAFLTVIFWATVASAFKIALRELHYIQVLLIANITSVIILAIILVMRHKSGKLLAGITSGGLLKSMLLGFLNPFAYYLVLFKAYSLLPAQVAQPVNFIWPVTLMVLAVPILKQKINSKGLLALLISFAGVIVISSQGNLIRFSIAEPFGIALALFSSVIWALFWIYNVKDGRDDVTKLFFNLLFSFLYILLLAWISGKLKMPVGKSFYAAIYIGIFEMGITFVFWLKALQLTTSTHKVSNIIYLTPFLSLLCVHFVLGEKLFYTSVIGLCLIIAGIIIQNIKN